MQTIVIKLGTSVLTQGSKSLNKAHMLEIVRQCALAHKAGHRVIVVTSGAIAAGREHLGFPKLPATVASKQFLASVGQTKLIQLWEQLFSIYEINIGQMLLTRADLEDRERFLNARDMLRALLDNRVIPVINENDAVATSEIKVGDNDNLSALAGILAEADCLVLLTDQDGLYTADPRNNPEATLIAKVENITPDVYALAGGSVSGLGTGGMATKIQAAEVANRAGIGVVIAAGGEPKNIAKILAGQSVGTFFAPNSCPLESRKRWLFGPPPAGFLEVDAGAAKALLTKGSSLLPKGITKIGGIFARGEVVRIVDSEQNTLAQGVSAYSSEDLERIKGQHSDNIVKILGYEHGSTAIHRDDCLIYPKHP